MTLALSQLWQDIRYALRKLMASPGFMIASVISIGCGIGASTAVFSQLNTFIFRPVPAIVDSPSLVTLRNPVSFPAFEAIRDHSEQFSDVAAYMGPIPMARNDVSPSVRVWGQFVTWNYFQLLGTGTQLGRAFGPDDGKRGIAPVAVVSEKLWREQLDGSAETVGKNLRLNGKIVTIIGVAATDFQGASPMMNSADIWIPATVDPTFAPELHNQLLNDKASARFSIIGRLQKGITYSEAEAKLDAIVKQAADLKPDDPQNHGRRVTLLPGGRRIPISDKDLPSLVAVPIILVGLVLWIACSNVGTMLLARSHARRKEIAIRLSLGASRSRMIRQLLTESILLAIMGGAGGLVFALWLANWSARAMKDFAPSFVNLNVDIDWKALLFAFAISIVSGIFFGLAPSLQATRGDLTQTLKPGSTWRLGGFRWFGARNILVLQQVAGSLMLLLITGFVVLGIQRTTSVDVGFDTHNLYMMSVDPLRDGYTPEDSDVWLTRLRDRVKRIPAVLDASLSYYAPVGMRSASASVQLKTDLDSLQEALKAIQVERVGLGYFETVGMKILHGRAFSERDAGVNRVVVNETFAKQWANQDPLGQDIKIQDHHFEVIGVVKDLNSGGVFSVAQPGVFELMDSSDFREPAPHGIVLVIRGKPGVDVLSAVRQDIASTDAKLTIFGVSSVQEEIDRALYLARATMFIYGGFGFFGLILASVGLGGVTSYAVVQRTKEIGIRVALGASKFEVLKLVTREGAVLIIVGTIIGQTMAYAATRAMSSWFNAVGEITKTSSHDPLLLIGAPILLAALAMIACYVPARRSLHIAPSAALREE